jgi:uncharacterized protein (UPF0276 family)
MCLTTPPASLGLPRAGGVGLKPEHFKEILSTRPAVGFFEIHAENYMVAGGWLHHYLERIRVNYPLSIHGVGLSLGGPEPPDELHLDRLATLIHRYQPEAFSEHLAWSNHSGIFLNDLLPVPYTPAMLVRVCEHIDRVQERLGLRMLLENPATYLEFESSTLDEADFISEVVRRTGCGLLLDINNAYVSCINHHRNTRAYLRSIPLWAVGEIHLAGYAEDIDTSGKSVLIDSHGTSINSEVWALYEFALSLLGPQPSLIERDANIPPLPVLIQEAHQAQHLLQRCAMVAA